MAINNSNNAVFTSTTNGLVPLSGGGTANYLRADGTFAAPAGTAATIAAQITGGAATATSGNPIIFPTVVHDTNSAYNASTGQYTAPSTGYYNVSVSYNAGSGTLILIFVYINGVQSTLLCDQDGVTGVATGSGLWFLTAGDTIDIRPNGTVAAMASAVSYSIFKLA